MQCGVPVRQFGTNRTAKFSKWDFLGRSCTRALLPCSNKQLDVILQLVVVQFEEIFVRTQDKPDLHNTLQLLSIKELFFSLNQAHFQK